MWVQTSQHIKTLSQADRQRNKKDWWGGSASEVPATSMQASVLIPSTHISLGWWYTCNPSTERGIGEGGAQGLLDSQPVWAKRWALGPVDQRIAWLKKTKKNKKKMIGIGLDSEEILTLTGACNPTVSNISTSEVVVYCKSENMQGFSLRFTTIHCQKFSPVKKKKPGSKPKWCEIKHTH